MLKRNIPIGISFKDIERIFEHFPRKQWKYIIAPLIYKADKRNKCLYIYNDEDIVRHPSLDTCYFELDNLEPGWTCPHDVGEYVTHKKLGGIYYIRYVGALDSRHPGTPREMMEYGNLYSVMGFNSEGRLFITNGADRDLYEGNTGYHMFKSVKRPDIQPGEFFYYVEMEHKGLLKQIDDESAFENYIYDNKINLKLGDTSHKEEYDQFFRDADGGKY